MRDNPDSLTSNKTWIDFNCFLFFCSLAVANDPEMHDDFFYAWNICRYGTFSKKQKGAQCLCIMQDAKQKFTDDQCVFLGC